MGGSTPMGRKRRILVIDDDRLLCELIRTTFELEGFEVDVAFDVIEAERILVGTRPDAILLDIGLPGIDGIFYLERLRETPQTSRIQTVAVLASALESRDFGTSRHSRRVTSYATRLTLEVAPGLLDDPSLEWGFLLHDVGKIGIPDGILLKPGQLTAAERRRMQEHAELGDRLLAHVPLLNQEGARVIRSHHERWDGNGYPDRLSEESIPLGARIFAVVDSLDAMTDERPYRAPVSWEAAAAEIRHRRGSHFDPAVVAGLEACEPDLYRLHMAELAAA